MNQVEAEQTCCNEARVSAYAAWVKRLRIGKPVPHLYSEYPGALARLGCELQLLAETLSRRNQETTRLIELALTIQQGLSVEDVLDRIYDGFAGLIPYDRIGCAFLSEDGRRVTGYWVRSKLGAIQICADYAQPLVGSSLEQVLSTRKPRILNDLEAYLRKKPQSESTRRIVTEGGRSSLTCPLMAGDRPVGFLFFTSRRKRAYREAHQDIFLQIASQVSTVVNKTRVYRTLADRNRQLTLSNRVLANAATHDALTGILNRAAVLAALRERHQEQGPVNGTVGLIMVDLDHFKAINDGFGHAAGDAVLIEFTRRISSCLRREDCFGRYGGEEFLIVTAGSPASVKATAERLRRVIIRRPFMIGGEGRRITASFGLAMSQGSHATDDDLLAAADQALYDAKSAGRNRITATWELAA